MAKPTKQATPSKSPPIPGVPKMMAPPKQVRITNTSSAEVHYMSQIKAAVDYSRSVNGKNIAIAILDSYVRDDSLIAFALKYFQSLLDPKATNYYDNYVEVGGNKIQISPVTSQPVFDRFQLFTVGVSDEYFDHLREWQDRADGVGGSSADDFIN